MKKFKNYPGWELKYFDKAKNFRSYQYDLIKSHIKGNVAEIGPGNGVFVNSYIKNAKKVFLFEPSKNFNKKLKKYESSKVSIVNKNFKERVNSLNAIIYLDVIEHIYDDLFEIKKAYKSLKKNGSLIINVPAFQHLYSQFDKDISHFRRYSKNDIIKLLIKANIKKYKVKYFDSVGYLLSMFSKILSKNYKKNLHIKIKLWDSLIPISKIIDSLVFHLFGKSLLIIIKK